MERKGTIRRTIYGITSEDAPIRIVISPQLMKRVETFLNYLNKLKLRKGEHIVFSIRSSKFTLLVDRSGVDLGEYGFLGWHSFLSYENLLTLPKVYFSQVFKQFLLLEREQKWQANCSKIIKKKDLVFLVWDKVAGKA